MSQILLYYRTIRYLKFTQIIFKIWYSLKKYSYDEKNLNFIIRKQPKREFFFLKKRNSILSSDKFKFINLVFKIDNKWNIKSDEKLWLYNLHYFDFLNSDFENLGYLQSLIDNWISIKSYSKKIGIEPYPTSLRIVNWVKFFIKYKISNKKFENSLLNQVLYLNNNLEYHLLGNHYFANLKAIIFGCLYFDNPTTNRILKDVIIKFKKELNSQILSDGGHCEFSPMYHAIILEDILDIISIFDFFQYKLDITFKRLLIQKTNKMFRWLSLLTHPNDEFCKFNDTTENIAPPLSILKKYLNRLFKVNYYDSEYNYLKNTSYFSLQNKKIFFCINLGPSSVDHLSGHTHSDTLSFELSYKQNIFFTNGGISTYKIGNKRKFERSSANHNTIIVDNKNISEVWKSFRLARRPLFGEPKIKKKIGKIEISNFFYDYLRKYKHLRKVIIDENKINLIDDNQSYNFFSRIILRPEINILKFEKNEILLKRKNDRVKIISNCGKMKLNKFKFKNEFESFKSTFCIDTYSINKKVNINMFLL